MLLARTGLEEIEKGRSNKNLRGRTGPTKTHALSVCHTPQHFFSHAHTPECSIHTPQAVRPALLSNSLFSFVSEHL